MKNLVRKALPQTTLDPRGARQILRMRVNEIIVPSAPELPAEVCEFLFNLMRRASVYLEYGTGGSTVAAVSRAGRVIAVEGDRRFLKAVAAKAGNPPNLTPVFVDIGLTGPWGNPVFVRPTQERLKKWACYPAKPWDDVLEPENLVPELILVDGRFRVACAAQSLMRLPENSDAIILFDDYAGRPHYREIEVVAGLERMIGRAAIFRKPKDFNAKRCAEILKRHGADWR